MSLRRKKGVQLCFPIVYGNSTVKLEESSPEYKQLNHTHRWTVYLRGCNQEDISYYIQKVVFKLHDSFENPIRTVSRYPFELTETGWGEFEVQMSVYLQDGIERPLKLTHMLRLFPLEEEQLLQERIYQSFTTTTIKKTTLPLLIVEQMDDLVINEPTEQFYHFAIEKFKTVTYPLRGPVFNRKLELQELDRLRQAQAQVTQMIEQYKWKLKQAEDKLHQSQKEKEKNVPHPSSSSSSTPISSHDTESYLGSK